MSHGRAVNSVFPSDKCLPRRHELFRQVPPRALLALKKAVYPMHPNAILHEIQQLYNVSHRLDWRNNIPSSQTHSSGSVRNTATLLEVLVATKMAPLYGLDPANA
jgi:hypothetical protein